jgi:PPOX class probable FMN-dependent enzyme
MPDSANVIANVATLERLYGAPSEASIVKEVDHVHPVYRKLIEASPFAILATSGPGGLDASPRGDGPGFVVVEDEKTLMLPDRRGNNRTDSLRNIIADSRIALLFLVPGIGETLRVNGRATISIDPVLLRRFAVDGKEPRSVIVIAVETVYFQCSRAVVRADLWNPAKHASRSALPSTGAILAALSNERIGGESYDRALPERLKTTLY